MGDGHRSVHVDEIGLGSIEENFAAVAPEQCWGGNAAVV